MSNVLRPLYMFPSVAEIPVEAVKRQYPDWQAATFDFDRCLTEHIGTVFPDEHVAKLAEMAATGLRLGIVSNAQSERARQRVRSGAHFLSAEIGQTVIVATSFDVNRRKPWPPIFDLAATELGLESSTIIHAGDLIMRDVIGPNVSGYLGAILVPPYGSAEGEVLKVRLLQRPAERLARLCMGLPARDKRFPSDFLNPGLDII